MPTSKNAKKPTNVRSVRKRPVPADYQDVVTDEHHERIKAAAKIKDLKNADIVSGPAW